MHEEYSPIMEVKFSRGAHVDVGEMRLGGSWDQCQGSLKGG